jgi:hypothetical protein
MYQNSYRSSLIILTDNKKGAQISYPEEITLAMLDAHDEIRAAISTLKNISSPPTPPLVSFYLSVFNCNVSLWVKYKNRWWIQKFQRIFK